MRRLTGVVAFALVASGCGGRERAGGDPPKEDPARAMIRLVEHAFAGRLDRSYAMLFREQRQAVNRKLYMRFPPCPPTTNVRIEVVGVHDALFDVPALGKIETKAVSYRRRRRGRESDQHLRQGPSDRARRGVAVDALARELLRAARRRVSIA